MNTSTSLPALSETTSASRYPERARVPTCPTPGSSNPRTPGGLSHSSSHPTLTYPVSSPSTKTCPPSATPPYNTPHKSSAGGSTNYHPYLIQSTSSSLLTRSNSSPSQPVHSLGRHKPSRSMSSLSYEGVPNETEGQEGNRRKSVDSPIAPVTPIRGLGRSGKAGGLAKYLDQGGAPVSKVKEVEMPLNPKAWTPLELALYLGQTLRRGGDDGTGQTLPGPLVEDIKSWVLRHQVTGRAFIRGNSDTWGNSSRPPPFLSLLQTISRRLRRASIQGDLADPLDETGSVLLETDEEDDGAEISAVKRMAHAYERRESGFASDVSSASEAEDGRKIRPQLTGGSEGWERWGVKRHHTGVKERPTDLMDSKHSKDALDPLDLFASSPEETIVTPQLGHEPDDMLALPDELEDEGGAGTIKAPPPGIAIADTASLVLPSLPSKSNDTRGASSPHTVELSRSTEGTPRAERDRLEITPTPERPTPSTSGLGFSPEQPGDDQKRPSPITRPSPSSSRYASLKGRGRVPTLRANKEDGYITSDEAATESMRRATLRPTHAALAAVFDVDRDKTSREVALEKQLAEMVERVKLLETRLEEASRSPSPVSSITNAGLTSPVEFVLEKLGFGSPPNDGLPTRVGELPGYLFLVGFGVGAVMMRVLFGRAR